MCKKIVKPNPLFEQWVDEDPEDFVRFSQRLLGELKRIVRIKQEAENGSN